MHPRICDASQHLAGGWGGRGRAGWSFAVKVLLLYALAQTHRPVPCALCLVLADGAVRDKPFLVCAMSREGTHETPLGAR